LVEADINSGARLVQRLDSSGFAVKAAFWWLDPETREWHLVVATPLVDDPGPRVAYERLQEAMAGIEDDSVPVTRVFLLSPNHPMISLLRGAISTGGEGISGIRFSRNTINGVFVEDAYIYRI